MTNRPSLKLIYKDFCLAEGNQHIASEYAVLKLQELVIEFKVKNILEIGLGIGAIAGSLLAVNKDIAYTGTENNEFCLKALKQNLGREYHRLEISSMIAALEPGVRFDLIIVDGKDLKLQKVKQIISPNAIIAIEGDRQEQEERMRNIFPNQLFVHCISKVKNKAYSPFPEDQWQGGIKVIFTNPTIPQRMWWMREKLSTKWKYLAVR